MVSYPRRLCLVRASLFLNTCTQEEARPGEVIPRLDLVCFPVFLPLHWLPCFCPCITVHKTLESLEVQNELSCSVHSPLAILGLLCSELSPRS